MVTYNAEKILILIYRINFLFNLNCINKKLKVTILKIV